jgi:hypothetical protein
MILLSPSGIEKITKGKRTKWWNTMDF